MQKTSWLSWLALLALMIINSVLYVMGTYTLLIFSVFAIGLFLATRGKKPFLLRIILVLVASLLLTTIVVPLICVCLVIIAMGLWQYLFIISHLPFSTFRLFSTLPERRVCGCSLRLKNES
jgi:fatty acid desaturase